MVTHIVNRIYKNKTSAPNLRTTPHTRDSFQECASMAHLQVVILLHSFEPNPPAVYVDTLLAPTVLVELTRCLCQSHMLCNDETTSAPIWHVQYAVPVSVYPLPLPINAMLTDVLYHSTHIAHSDVTCTACRLTNPICCVMVERTEGLY